MAGPLKSGKIQSKVNLAKKRFAIVVAEWNDDVTDALYESAVASLKSHGVKAENILKKTVPGTFELSLAALWMGEKKDIDAIICLGCVIQGETPHFDFVAGEAARGATQASLQSGVPVLFGVITADTVKQAVDRCGSRSANKGYEAAMAAIEVVNLYRRMDSEQGLKGKEKKFSHGI